MDTITALKQLHDITSDAAPLDTKIQRVLELGNAYFEADLAIISRINQADYTVFRHQPVGVLEDGQRFVLGYTYCDIAITAGGTVAINDMEMSQYYTHPCYASFGLEMYIGTPLRNKNGEALGTLNFSRGSKREQPFTDADRSLLQRMAGWLEHNLVAEDTYVKIASAAQRLLR